uniref:Uncharacterized protein n=1 Tax=Panagrolaimus sp. ES5 TaxID=591445 RepID=A0AC34GSK4_9BILA
MNGMIDNITALYFFIAHQPRTDSIRQNFKQITLIVVDFCLGAALHQQLKRLSYLLHSTAHGQPSTATIITTTFGDDAILGELEQLAFTFTHRGFLKDADGNYEMFDYFTQRTSSNKEITLGFRCRHVLPLKFEELPIIEI